MYRSFRLCACFVCFSVLFDCLVLFTICALRAERASERSEPSARSDPDACTFSEILAMPHSILSSLHSPSKLQCSDISFNEVRVLFSYYFFMLVCLFLRLLVSFFCLLDCLLVARCFRRICMHLAHEWCMQLSRA